MGDEAASGLGVRSGDSHFGPHSALGDDLPGVPALYRTARRAVALDALAPLARRARPHRGRVDDDPKGAAQQGICRWEGSAARGTGLTNPQ